MCVRTQHELLDLDFLHGVRRYRLLGLTTPHIAKMNKNEYPIHSVLRGVLRASPSYLFGEGVDDAFGSRLSGWPNKKYGTTW